MARAGSECSPSDQQHAAVVAVQVVCLDPACGKVTHQHEYTQHFFNTRVRGGMHEGRGAPLCCTAIRGCQSAVLYLCGAASPLCSAAMQVTAPAEWPAHSCSLPAHRSQPAGHGAAPGGAAGGRGPAQGAAGAQDAGRAPAQGGGPPAQDLRHRQGCALCRGWCRSPSYGSLCWERIHGECGAGMCRAVQGCAGMWSSVVCHVSRQEGHQLQPARCDTLVPSLTLRSCSCPSLQAVATRPGPSPSGWRPRPACSACR